MAAEEDQSRVDHPPSGSDDSSSDSESDFEVVDISEDDSKRIMALEAALQENPNQYDNHVQLLEMLRRCGMKERLREARQAMHALFPLSESLWLDWVGDELEGVGGEEDIPRIRGLLEDSVGDYLSLNLWLQYLGFMRELDPEISGRTPEGLGRMRELYERALTAGGLHVTEGSRLWEAYRGFEESLLEETASAEQADRVRALFQRQLAVPLADGDETLEAYRAWERAQQGSEAQEFQVPRHVTAAHSKAQRLAELRQPYEEAVSPEHAPDAELLAGYMAYIKAEEAHADPARVQVIYERALAVFPVTHYLWLQYARYLEAHLKIPALVNATYQRAVRNCPWVWELWSRYLRALERGGTSEEQHAAVFKQALAAGLQGYEDVLGVFLARLDFLRRRGDTRQLRETFREASQQLQAAYPDALDRTYRLTQYWADCEAAAGDLAAARAVWEAVLKTAAGRYADCWGAYIALERRLGNVREARGLYKRCYSRRMEEAGQALLCEAWLRFEREEGSAEDHFAASLKVDPILAEVQSQQAAAADVAAAAQARAAAAKAPKLSKEEMKQLRQQSDPNFRKKAGQKREAPGAGEQQEGGDMPPPPKKPRATSASKPPQQQQEQPPKSQPSGAAPQQGEGTAPAALGTVAKAEGSEQEAGQQEQQQQQQQGEPGEKPHASVTAKGLNKTGPTTAFVKHLADEVDEAQLEALFAPCGRIAALKLGRDQEGRPRGFAYVEFLDDEGMKRACGLSGQEVHGKHIMVAHSQPPSAGFGGRGGRGGRGGDFGGRRGGRGRGRFDSGGGRGGRGGRGANPHQRAHLDLGGGAPAQEGAGKPALGFMPRAAALHQGAGAGGGGGQPPKSNADFRKLMLGGK